VGISAALIVRDEADHLPGCLDCLQPFAAEICVVDTGSTDDTPDIARRYGATVFAFPWTDNFSDARNRALELCSHEWVFSIDADERLAPQDIPHLAALARLPADRGYRFITRTYTHNADLSEFIACPPGDPMALGFRGWTPSTKVRLFPNRPDVRFEGAVHELVNPSLERLGLPLLDAPLPIHHYPLLRSPERLRQKRELYLALGRRKVAEHPEDAKAYLELGNQYAEVGDAVQAVRAFSEALRRAPRDPLVLRSLGTALHLVGRSAEAERSLDLALSMDPSSADGWRNLGVVRAAQEEWEGALACFRRALDLNPAWIDGHRYIRVALDRLQQNSE
jgi:tetratricopeptide (TPR) repeat protein